MIGLIEGIVAIVRGTFLIVNTNGVGYKIFATKDTLARYAEGSSAFLWTHLAVRENALDLYGFENEQELNFFELLLTVSGIGPKSALGILDVAGVESLRAAIAAGKAGSLTSVSGIGKKTAEKIVLELKDKIGPIADGSAIHANDTDTIEALKTLGYSPYEAREAARKISSEIADASSRLREALRILGTR